MISTHCGDAKCSENRLQLNEQRLLPRTNFASLALIDNTRSATAHSPGNAQQMVVEVPKTLFYTLQRVYSRESLNLEEIAMGKQLVAAQRQAT